MPISRKISTIATIKQPTVSDNNFTAAGTDFGAIDSSYGYPNSGLGNTPVNLTFSVLGGKTLVTFPWAYPLNVNPGLPYGSIDVYINGQIVPRYIAGSTAGAYYTEQSPTSILLDQDYSGWTIDVEVLQRATVIDTNTQNTTAIAELVALDTACFQGFVNTSNFLTAVNGAPATGQFFSTIQNRAPLVDLTRDLKPRMGIERIMAQNNYQLQTEFGPNGENVYALENDTFGQVRLVGRWLNKYSSNGYRSVNIAASSTDYIEITFYGTGLNLLAYPNTEQFQAKVDNGAFSGNLVPAGASSALGSQYYSQNVIISVASGLSLGVHTVTIQAVSSFLDFYGCEIINTNATSTNLSVNPGTSYVNGGALSLGIQNLSNFNSGFTNTYGVATSKGGHVLVYQAPDGSIKKDIQHTNFINNIGPGSSHANEEIARTYSFTEFGTGGSNSNDIFQIGHSTNVVATYTLDDNTTTLMGNNLESNDNGALGIHAGGANAYWVFTFVGTGLDIYCMDDATIGTTPLDAHAVYIDGVFAFNITGTSSNITRQICSGYPYGTHTVKIERTAFTANAGVGVINFIVYQPKIPPLPAGCVALGDYLTLAQYDPSVVTDNTVATGFLQNPSGVIFKSCTREFLLVGADWALGPVAVSSTGAPPAGTQITTNTHNTEPVSYTFWGTGCVLLWDCSSGGTFATNVLMDGVPIATGVNRGNMVNSGGGTYTTTSSTSWAPGRVEFTGLTLGLHTITAARASGAGNFAIVGIDIITPIYSPKSNLFSDLQNSLPVGSNAINDARKFTPVEDDISAEKNWVQAQGIIASPTSSVIALRALPDMN